MHASDLVQLPDTPPIRGLVFRRFRGEPDYVHMHAVLEAHTIGHGIEHANSIEELEFVFAHLVNCDPYRDVLVAEIDGEVIAFSRVWWQALEDGTRLYKSLGFLSPAWQRNGIGGAMLNYNETLLRQIADLHPVEIPKFFQGWASDRETPAHALFTASGYQPARVHGEMTRPITPPPSDAPLPAGLAVRPVVEAHVTAIWEAREEAYRDHWGYAPAGKQEYQRWLNNPRTRPELWKVAWDGDQVAGMVLNWLNEAENAKYQRLRGYTQEIFVRRPWRRRGLARALLTQSIEMFADLGMQETALSLDLKNPSGALAFYASLGYRIMLKHTVYRKAMPQSQVHGHGS